LKFNGDHENSYTSVIEENEMYGPDEEEDLSN
jgi:hypothetical protein